MVTQTQTPAMTATQTAWTPEEIAARKALWVATAARLAATMPMETTDDRTAYLAAVETVVGCTYAALQRAICQAAGPAPASVVANERRIMARGEPTRGTYDGPEEAGDVRGDDRARHLALVA
jgi:hypothetical protein